MVDEKGLTNTWHYSITGYHGGAGNWIIENSAYLDHYGYYYPPLILDLNADGIHFTSIQNSNISIDVNNDGVKDKIAWAGNDDGVLVWDKDHNQQISDISEFGFQHLRAEAQTDLEGLQALDTNHNGLLDAGDDKFAEFAVWQDANGNGAVDEGEFLTLQERGIASINLHSDGQMRDAGTLLEGSLTGETDATVMGNAAFTRTDGSTGVVADAMLAFAPGRASVAAQTSAAVAQETASSAPNNAAEAGSTAPASHAASEGVETAHASPAANLPAALALDHPPSLLVDAAALSEPSASFATSLHAAPSAQAADGTATEQAAVAVDVEAAGAAELARQAALFNQFCSVDVIGAVEPLGFVALEQTMPLIDLQLISQDDAYYRPQAA